MASTELRDGRRYPRHGGGVCADFGGSYPGGARLSLASVDLAARDP